MKENEINLGVTIIPKSDQLNADDLIAGAKTIKIRDVKQIDSEQQPISIYFEGDNNKPYKPSKGMRRVMVQLWGTNGLEYIGRSLTLFRDETVKFSGAEVGGIVISHASHIDEPKRIITTVSRGKKKMLTITPLNHVESTPIDIAPYLAQLSDCKTLNELKSIYTLFSKEVRDNSVIIAKKDELKSILQ
jgi:hypothetical protein